MIKGQSRIPVSEPKRAIERHGPEIHEAINRVLDSGWFIGGAEVKAFETEFATYLGVQHAIGVGSGTDAIEIALRACGIQPGDHVATVSLTSVATVAAIERSGATPVLVDVDPWTLNLDPAALARICERTRIRAVIPVHLYGLPANMGPILEIASRQGVTVIEDCAQAHGARLHGRACGTFGDLAAFSFYPTKNLGALGDGGAVVTNHAALADRVRRLREYGWRQRNDSEIPGVCSRLDALQAAVLRVKLKHLDDHNARRREIARHYTESSRHMEITSPPDFAGATHVYHQYVVRVPNRPMLQEHLAERGIDTAIHYEHPVHLQPAYRARKLTAGAQLAHTETACREILSLPVFPELTECEVQRVARALAAYR